MAAQKTPRIRTMADLITACNRLVGKKHYLSIKAEFTGNDTRKDRYEKFTFQVYHEHFGHSGESTTPQGAYDLFRMNVKARREGTKKAPPVMDSAALVPSVKSEA